MQMNEDGTFDYIFPVKTKNIKSIHVNLNSRIIPEELNFIFQSIEDNIDQFDKMRDIFPNKTGFLYNIGFLEGLIFLLTDIFEFDLNKMRINEEVFIRLSKITFESYMMDGLDKIDLDIDSEVTRRSIMFISAIRGYESALKYTGADGDDATFYAFIKDWQDMIKR